MTDHAPLVTAAEVRASMRVPGAWSDVVLTGLVARAEARVRRFCRWHVWPIVDETVTVPTNGDGSVLLRSLRVHSISEVLVQGTPVGSDHIDWSTDGRLRIIGGRFPDALRGVEVTLSHGYDPDDIDDVRDVVLGMLERTLSLPVGIKASSTGDKSVEYAVESSLRPTLGDREVLTEFRINR